MVFFFAVKYVIVKLIWSERKSEMCDQTETPVVCVLLSAYNGENYIEEQLDSIRLQKSVRVKILARDDGSTDDTVRVLEAYREKYPGLLTVIKGSNIGWRKSFMELLYLAPDAEYYSYSDQDDVWETDKLLRAVTRLKRVKHPVALYTGNVWVTDAELKITGSFAPEGVDMMKRPLMQLIMRKGILGYGMSQVFTREARKKILKLYPGGMKGHDEFTFLTCLYLGEVVYDPEPSVYYRQHGKNEIGTQKKGILWVLHEQIRQLLQPSNAKGRQLARLFLDTFDEIKERPEIYRALCTISDYPKNLKTRMALIRYPGMRREKRSDSLRLYLKILLNRY